MSYKCFHDWADEHAHFVRLEVGSALWLPYGWYAAALFRPGQSNFGALFVQPYITKALADKCGQWQAVSSALKEIIEANLQSGRERMSDAVKKETMEWLVSSGTPSASASHADSKEAPIPIMDIKKAEEPGQAEQAPVAPKESQPAREPESDEDSQKPEQEPQPASINVD